MSTIKDGGTAFPLPATEMHGFEAGMSLRDYFAAKALAAMIGHEGKDYSNCGAIGVPKLAAWAYEYADAMLRAREVQS
jgi:hypothetical protein